MTNKADHLQLNMLKRRKIVMWNDYKKRIISKLWLEMAVIKVGFYYDIMIVNIASYRY